MYAALFFFMHVYVGYYFWGGIIIRSEGVFPIELVRDHTISHGNWYNERHKSRTAHEQV